MGRRPYELRAAFPLAEAGMPAYLIARELGISVGAVNYWAQRNGIALGHERKKSAFPALAAQGRSVQGIADSLGVARQTVARWAKDAGIDLPDGRGGNKGVRDTERAEKMALMYRQGLTLEKIGQSFGVTRERVRQILKRSGVVRTEGGQAKISKAKAGAKTAKQDARYLARHGLTFAEYVEVRDTGLIAAYRNQANSAKSRGIEWGLNLAQWLDIWKTSGKLHLRGRGKGKYLMSRIKDTGGYVIGNVHIQLATENSREAVEQWRGKFKKNPGVHLLYPGLAKPYLVKVAKKFVGYYASEEEGVAARIDYINANGLAVTPSGRVCSRKAA